MKVLLLVIGISSSMAAYSQNILPNANVIIVKNVGFNEICNALLDSGYSIEKKDQELQTVRTEPKNYPKYWNATYVINVRVKDSIAYISAISKSALGEMEVSNHVNRHGETYKKSLDGFPFLILNTFALSFKRSIDYEKR